MGAENITLKTISLTSQRGYCTFGENCLVHRPPIVNL